MRGGHFFFLHIFVFSPLSEGKMDWGLLLHCAALTFTLARALRSGECRGDGGSEPGGRLRGCGSGGRAVGPLRATSPPGTFRWGTGAVRSSPGTSGPGIAF